MSRQPKLHNVFNRKLLLAKPVTTIKKSYTIEVFPWKYKVKFSGSCYIISRYKFSSSRYRPKLWDISFETFWSKMVGKINKTLPSMTFSLMGNPTEPAIAVLKFSFNGYQCVLKRGRLFMPVAHSYVANIDPIIKVLDSLLPKR